MCGIYGLWHFDGQPIRRQALEQATTVLSHRGPDDEGYLLVDTHTNQCCACGGAQTDPRLSLPRLDAVDGATFDLALGFRRLAILDLSPAGHQPMCSPDGRLWIVFNGEIYNYLELRAELKQYGHTFHTETDTEVILAAYRQWGAGCLERFNGMWALAIWNGWKQTLFLARDRFGIKPLYYVHQDRAFAFASEIKALVGEYGIPFRPDEWSIYRYLVSGLLPNPGEGATFFEGVRSLPPGHWLTVRADGTLAVHRYWRLPVQSARPVSIDAAEVTRDYRDLFMDAVRLRLRSDVPVGTCLSGGVDSSSIVCAINYLMTQEGLTADQIGLRQRTFSAVYKETARYNEQPFIEQVLRATGAEGNFAFPTQERLQAELERLIWHQDEPFPSTGIFAQWCVMNRACERGVTVLLDGQGADETLAGYRPFAFWLSGLLRQRQLRRALAEAKAIHRQTGVPPWPFWGRALLWQLPDRWVDGLRHEYADSWLDNAAISVDLSSRYRHEPVLKWLPRRDHHDLDAHLQDQIEETSLPHLLRYEDRNSMAFGVEARVPFLDYRLVQFVFNQAADWRIHQGWTKWVLRKAMEPFVPGEVIWRKDKVGFETPEREWLRQWLRREPDLFNENALSHPYLDVEHVRARLAQWIEKSDTPSWPVWRWINLEMWLRVWQSR